MAQVANPISIENSQPGNPASEWDISGDGDPSIQGFATDISINRGQTIPFKVKTNATNYRLDIYRLGYYSGAGARKVATVQPSVTLPQNQPNCLTDAVTGPQDTGLIDCGNWAVSASWAVPANATSGIYLVKLVRPDTGGASHIVFIVRDDTSTSDLLFQTSDTTWHAYNIYGNKNLYTGGPGPQGGAYKVSYNRPFNTRVYDGNTDWLFNAEYPLVRWLEANGYNVSYFTGVDSDRRGDLIKNHKVFLSVGHDEYWSGTQRTKVEAARNTGVHLAFFSGNEVFWKTRWENSIDGSNTPYRTLVSYKETHANAVIDPQDPPTWTGTWRDPRFSPPADGGRPENALTGTIFTVNGNTSAITVPEADGKMRFWRNTSIATLAPGSSATLPNGTLGVEWDEDLDNGFRPSGLFGLSSTTVNVPQRLLDYGSNYGPGIATHRLTLYKHSNGALVFGSGTYQWSWGLDNKHDNGSTAPDTRMKQATVNLFADMGVQPVTLQSGLGPATASTDTTAPSSTITSPIAGTSVQIGSSVTISGNSTDSGGASPQGRVGGVEVSVDGGTTWHPANGRTSWNYTWSPIAAGTVTIKSRAVDDSGNLEIPQAGVPVTIVTRTCSQQPCSIWSSTATPTNPSENDTAAVEVGVKFRSDVNGFITGIRFYKGSGNTGTHVGTLWSSTGTLLAQATFSGETTTGWQQVTFSTPVAVTANTTYVASYHTNVGRYAADGNFFATGVDNAPLHALSDGVAAGNGVYRYSATPIFPNATFQSTNYWVDVVFTTVSAPDTTAPTVSSTTPTSGATNINTGTTVKATFSEAMAPATISTSTFELRNSANALVTATVSYDAASKTATLTPSSALAISTTYTATVKGGTTDPRVKDLAGNALAANFSWSFTTGAAPCSQQPCSIWPSTATPTNPSENDTAAVELGVKFRSDVSGRITGIRFYKGSGNTGTHVGTLWSSTGTQLARATFSGETASGWQQVTFATPVAVTANTVYVASYHTDVGRYAADGNFFATVGVDNAPLHALSNGVAAGNGVYRYSATPIFPNSNFQSTNYWVDVLLAIP
jgi:Domain of unknown function (DUF4082)/Bacterial Ig-like domain/Bacterial Ig domain